MLPKKDCLEQGTERDKWKFWLEDIFKILKFNH